jgi:hypothetical protein
MARFMVEVSHEAEFEACVRAIEVFHETGSHYLTNADWGCLDDVHKTWFILEAEDKEEALYVVPPAYRPQTVITCLTKFTPDDLDELIRHHQG